MDPLWITIAFVGGFSIRLLGLPPLVGFLLAGFVLNLLGVEGGETLQLVADLGVTLLLFTIGLKLKVKSLLKPVIWLGTSGHMLVTMAVLLGLLKFGAWLGIGLFTELDLAGMLLVAFALSFSSTVFAVKVLEAKGEMSAGHGTLSIGILVMQDVLAVVFLTASSGKFPSPWAILVLAGLFLIRPWLNRIMDRCDHGELVTLYGFFLALVVGSASFEAVAMKADLGALLIGMLVANHPKSKELAKNLLGFKEVFLVGFFLSIGLAATPTWDALLLAGMMVLFIPLKTAMFFLFLCHFRLRARSSLLSALTLSNYSEFGLIVGAVAVANGWLAVDWLIIIALALSLSFVLAAPLNTAGHKIYQRFHLLLARFERKGLHPDDLSQPLMANVAIIGMGRIGTGAYDLMNERCDANVVGIDFSEKAVEDHRQEGRTAILGDASDPDFWEMLKMRGDFDQLELVLLAMHKHQANLFALDQLKKAGFTGGITAIAMYEDQRQELLKAGAHAAHNFYAEAGAGFAEHAYMESLQAGFLPGVCETPPKPT